jgi:magnesium-transporting ATPase (P-type)
MKDNIANITRWVLIVLLALSVVSGLIFYFMYDSSKPMEVLLEDLDNKYFVQILNWAGILLGLTVIISVISPIYEFIINPKNVKKLLVSLAVAVVVVVIAYSLADNTVTEVQSVKYGLTEAGSKRVGVGLYTTYIGFGLAVIALIYSSVVKMFK